LIAAKATVTIASDSTQHELRQKIEAELGLNMADFALLRMSSNKFGPSRKGFVEVPFEIDCKGIKSFIGQSKLYVRLSEVIESLIISPIYTRLSLQQSPQQQQTRPLALLQPSTSGVQVSVKEIWSFEKK
jgi:hypothetical protein